MNGQTREALCLIPVLVFFAVAAIRRGWDTLSHHELNLPLNEKMYIGLVRLFKGNESADKAYKNTTEKFDIIVYYAWMNIIGGGVTLVICLVWVIVIM